MSRLAHGVGFVFGAGLLLALVLPLGTLALSASPREIARGMSHPLFFPALLLSLRTTFCTVAIIVITGTPLAWWLTTTTSRLARIVELLVELPIVLPPAVAGVALLSTFGRQGLLGPVLQRINVQIPFTDEAVLLAQLVVSAPFFVQAAANAFRKIDLDLLIVARTLGASGPAALFRVAIPIALPGLIVGASLAWARSLGEFGATLLFAGNLPGSTQTLPLAIFSALESDIHLAVVFSLILAALGAVILLFLRWVPTLFRSRSEGSAQLYLPTSRLP